MLCQRPLLAPQGIYNEHPKNSTLQNTHTLLGRSGQFSRQLCDSTKDEGSGFSPFALDRHKAAKSQGREPVPVKIYLCFLRGRARVPGLSVTSCTTFSRKCIRALWEIPFLISIAGLAHLPHLSDQAISNLHLVIGLSKTLVQFSAPSQLYSISIFQFLKECGEAH